MDADPITGVQQFTALEQHYKRVSPMAKAILLSSFIKMQHLYPELVPTMGDLFRMNADAQDAEVRAREASPHAVKPSVEFVRNVPPVKGRVVGARVCVLEEEAYLLSVVS